MTSILLIDDDEVDRQSIRRALRQTDLDAKIAEAADAAAGMEMLRRTDFDCVLLDYRLPDMDGVNLLAELGSGRDEQVPVIMLTGNRDERTAVQAIRAGAQDYLIKGSVTADGLRRSIASAIRVVAADNRRRAAEAETSNILQALRESEARFRGAFETAPHGMALVGLDGRWLKVNPAAVDMLGYGEEELLRTDFQTITHPDDLALDLDYVRRLSDGEIRFYQMEKRYLRKDGDVVPALLSVSLVRDPEGAPLHFVSQFIDLTERKQVEAQLQQANKMEAVGRLTGGVAHDFNNLLTIILGNAQILEPMVAEDEQLPKFVNQIQDAARRGGALTRQLLAFSRKQDLAIEKVDINALIEGLEELLRRSLGEAIEIDTDLAADVWAVRTDRNLLENAVLNLAVNARDAMPEGGRLTIATANVTEESRTFLLKRDAAAGDYVLLTVRDTGFGMAPETLEHVLEPFFTTKDVGKGTGLGLSMVYGFVEQSGGKINIDSDIGKGTAVELYLPKAVEEEEEVTTAARAGPTEQPHGGGE